MTYIGKWALLTVKFILEDLHGSSDHPSSTAKRINCRTYMYLNSTKPHITPLLASFWANEPADSFCCERSGNCFLLWQEEVKMATAQVGLWTLLPFIYLLWLRMLTMNNICRFKRGLCYFLPNQIVYLYVLGTEWWCFEAKCQSFYPEGLLAWNRVSLSKQVPTRIRRKGGFYEFLFYLSVSL